MWAILVAGPDCESHKEALTEFPPNTCFKLFKILTQLLSDLLHRLKDLLVSKPEGQCEEGFPPRTTPDRDGDNAAPEASETGRTAGGRWCV